MNLDTGWNNQDDGRNRMKGWKVTPAVQLVPASSHIVAPLSNVDLGTVSGVECFGWVMVVEVVVDGIWTIGLAGEVLLCEGGRWALGARFEGQWQWGCVGTDGE